MMLSTIPVLSQRSMRLVRSSRSIHPRRSPGRVLIAAAIAVVAGAPLRAVAQEAPAPDEKAAAAFAEVVKAHRVRPALEVKSTHKIKLLHGGPAGETSAESEGPPATMTWRRGGEGMVKIRDFTCWFGGGKFFATNAATESAYFAADYEGAPYWALFNAFVDMPYPHMAILWGEEAMDEVWMMLEPATPEIVPVEVADETKDGAVLRRIVFRGPGGSLTMRVDPETKFIRSMEHEVTGGDSVQPGTRRVTTYALEYKTEGLPESLAFDPGARERVDLLPALLPRPQVPDVAAGGGGIAMPAEGPLIGKPAPAFILATADGGAVDLDDLRGRVVVLDFWATWCAPCRAALPKLHEVAAWARERGMPVEFVTINVWESRDPAKDSPDERLKSVRAFWERSGYTLPVAMDYTDETAMAYGVQGIPATFVIRADGIVHAKPVPDVDLLKQSIEAAVEAAPPAPRDGA